MCAARMTCSRISNSSFTLCVPVREIRLPRVVAIQVKCDDFPSDAEQLWFGRTYRKSHRLIFNTCQFAYAFSGPAFSVDDSAGQLLFHAWRYVRTLGRPCARGGGNDRLQLHAINVICRMSETKKDYGITTRLIAECSANPAKWVYSSAAASLSLCVCVFVRLSLSLSLSLSLCELVCAHMRTQSYCTR